MSGAGTRAQRSIGAATPSIPISETTTWRPLGVVLVGTFLIVLDFFIVNVALPSIRQHLNATPAELEWVVAGYGLTFAALLITGGRIGDRIGRRFAFSVGVGIFVVASTACGLAPTAATLIAARLTQGAGAALISPNVLSIVGTLYTGANRVRAITVYGVVMGVAATFGQVIGGLLIHANIAGSSWRAIFLINVPLGVGTLLIAPRLVPESRSPTPKPLDVVGILLITAGLTAVVLPLVQGRELGWPLWTWLSLAAVAPIVALLRRHQRRLVRQGREPLLHPAGFEQPQLRVGFAVQLVCWCTQAAFFLVLALYLQDGRGLNALHAGLMFMFLAGAYVVVSFRAPALTRRYGRDLIAIGTLTVAAGDLALLAAANLRPGQLAALAPGLVIVGAGQGLWITPLTTTVMAFAEPQRAGLVSGTLSTMQQVGNCLGVAVTGEVFFTTLHRSYSTAFTYALIELTGAMLVAAALTRLLHRQPNRDPSTTRTGSARR